MQINESIENYLETILILQKDTGAVRSINIAKKLSVTKPSVSYATKRLRENGYITMEKDGLISLTDTGYAIAHEIYERHKVLTDFLMRLGVPEATAREDACKIEHDLSADTFNAICDYAKRARD